MGFNVTQTPVPSTEPQHINIDDIVANQGDPPWEKWLFTDGRNNIGLICEPSGMETPPHIHKNFNEWWVVLQGEIIWEIGDYPPIRAKSGDVIICPKGRRHAVKTVGEEVSLRLHINAPWSSHDVRGERSSVLQPFPMTEPPNMLFNDKGALLKTFGVPPWVTSILDDDRNQAGLIAHGKGMTNNAHWHPDFNEWWVILQGDLTFEIGEGRPVINATRGDIVFVPEGMKHFISSVGDGTSLRLAVTNSENLHVYTADDDSAPPPVS